MNQNKRWEDRTQRWVQPRDLFDPKGFSVDVIERDRPAKAFIEQHHYSGTYPAARFRVGLYGPQAMLMGVAVFSVPMNNQVLRRWLGTDSGVELGRFVMLPEVGYNGETWFLARALPLVQAGLGVTGILSCADPLERRAGALVIKPAHWGTIYQASNAVYAGRTKARTQLLAPDGTLLSPRALSKIRNEERGYEYAMRQLLEAGAPRRGLGEPLTAWLERAVQTFDRVPHPGNLAYVFGLTKAAKRRLHDLHRGGLPYEKAA